MEFEKIKENNQATPTENLEERGKIEDILKESPIYDKVTEEEKKDLIERLVKYFEHKD